MSIPVRKPCLRIPIKPDCGCLNCAAWRKYLVSVGGCEHLRWAPATLRGKDDKDGYEVCAECGVFRDRSGMLWDANTFELAAYGGLAGTVDKLLPVDEEADRRADEFEAKRKIEKAYFECEFPGCTTRVGTKIGGKAACLQHVRALTTVGERRESVGLDPKVEVAEPEQPTDTEIRSARLIGWARLLLQRARDRTDAQVFPTWLEDVGEWLEEAKRWPGPEKDWDEEVMGG